nr:acylsugar acyltransferase 3-like [Nicotiana tomentosiformis]
MAVSRIISVSEKIIKPSSATPSPLRNYKLSLLDQVMSTMEYCYNNLDKIDQFNDIEQMIRARVIQELRKGKEQLKKKHHVKQNGLLSALQYFDEGIRPDNTNDNIVDVCWFTSLCNYQLYNVDFRWGRPERAVVASGGLNSIFLSDDREGDGVEALVSLDKAVMSEFNTNKELLEFASVLLN